MTVVDTHRPCPEELLTGNREEPYEGGSQETEEQLTACHLKCRP